jgi:integrase
VPEFEEMLERVREKQLANIALCGDCYSNDYLDYICVDVLGERIKPGYITSAFPAMLERNNLRRIRYHDLRHTCASLLLASGVSMKEIQEWLGHSNFSTTANCYTHLAKDAKQNSANAMRTSGIILTTFMPQPVH